MQNMVLWEYLEINVCVNLLDIWGLILSLHPANERRYKPRISPGLCIYNMVTLFDDVSRVMLEL